MALSCVQKVNKVQYIASKSIYGNIQSFQMEFDGLKMKIKELVVNSQINRTVGYFKPNTIYLFTYFVVLRIKLRPGLMAKFGSKYKCQDKMAMPS